MRDHQQVVKGVTVQPDKQIFVSLGKDSSARFFDINDQCMIDCNLDKPARSAILWSQFGADGVDAIETINQQQFSLFTIGHGDGLFSVWHTDITAAIAANQYDDEDRDPFYDQENAFGGIHWCSNQLLRPAAPVGNSRRPSEQAFCVKYTPESKYFVVALGENCVDIYKHAVKLIDQQPSRNVMEHAKQKTH